MYHKLFSKCLLLCEIIISLVTVNYCSSDATEKVDKISLESDEDDHVQPVSKFGLLSIDDASDSDSEPESDIISSSSKQTKNMKQTAAAKVEDKIVTKGTAKKQANKGKADTKKPKDEDDIDELLAELDAPKSVKTVEKKEKKKKKGGNVDDDVKQVDTGTHPSVSATVEPEIDYRNMTQDEIAKIMEEQYGEDSEEERKKAKSKKKMRKAKDDTKQIENDEQGKTYGKIVDKPNDEAGKDDEKDADAEVTVNVPKTTKKQNKKTLQTQSEVFIAVFNFYVTFFIIL